MLAFCAIATVLILARMFAFSAHGIDLTDESFYLVWVASPFSYEVSASHFGLLYHPLYLLFDGDLAHLRQANIAITFGLAWVLTWQLVRTLAPDSTLARLPTGIWAAGIAISSLTVFDSWLVTPSYNSLALQALLVFAIGTVLADRTSTPRSVLGWILIGVGGWLAFMSKPTTALALAVLTPFYLALARKLNFGLAAVSLGCATALVLATAIVLDGAVQPFVQRLQSAITFAELMGGGHTAERVLRIDTFKPGRRDKIAFLVCISLFLAALILHNGRSKAGKRAALLLSGAFALVVVVLVAGMVPASPGFNSYQGMLVWSVVIPVVALPAMTYRWRLAAAVPSSHWATAALFLMLPHVYAFGSNQNYWVTGSSAAVFWLLAGVVVASPMAREQKNLTFLWPAVMATLAVTAVLLQTAFEKPYRQPQPLRLNDRVVELGTPRSRLVLSGPFADYFERARAAAYRVGFQPGDPIVDLTGQSPGILYHLGASSVGQPWIIGGYRGSLDLATAILGRVPCEELASAWLLYEPHGPRRIPDEVLGSFGAVLTGHYTESASWNTAPGAGGYAGARLQVLYKPTRPNELLESCRIRRAAGGAASPTSRS